MHLARRRLSRKGAGVVLITAVLLAGCTPGPAPAPGPSSSSVSGPTSQSPRTGPTRTIPSPGSADGTIPTASSSSTPDSDRAPAVVGLRWLGPRPNAPGVEIAVSSGTRWQGRLPGEYALVDGKAHQWFGADGSVVGCSTKGACVGIDAAGYTAVAPKGTTRLVYRPDGKPLGRFAPTGRRLREEKLPAMASAVAATKVDLAALLDAATRSTPFAGGVTGDPHFLTAGGFRYSTQLTGEYQARAGDPEHDIQLRLEPLQHQPNVSVVSAVAVRSGDAIVELDADGALSIDHQSIPAPDAFHQYSIPGGPEIGRWLSDELGTMVLAMAWTDGSTLVMSANPDLGMTVVLMAARTSGVAGLFGTESLDPADDLQDRDGTTLDLGTVVRDWLVPADESLFDERVESTLGFPSALATVPAAAEEFARRACAASGLTNQDDMAACAFDVGLTGDDGFVAGHAAMVRPAQRHPAAAVANRWPALELGAVTEEHELTELVDIELKPGERQVYQLPVEQAGAVQFEFVTGCHDDVGEYPGPGHPAVRLFDVTGHPVSARLSTCGQPQTAALAAGTYHLVIAGPSAGPAADVRVAVHLP